MLDPKVQQNEIETLITGKPPLFVPIKGEQVEILEVGTFHVARLQNLVSIAMPLIRDALGPAFLMIGEKNVGNVTYSHGTLIQSALMNEKFTIPFIEWIELCLNKPKFITEKRISPKGQVMLFKHIVEHNELEEFVPFLDSAMVVIKVGLSQKDLRKPTKK
jgi:hypothetical protein